MKIKGLTFDAAVAVNEVTDAFVRATGLPLIEVGIVPPPNKAELSFLNENGKTCDTFIAECGVMLYGTQPCVLFRVKQEEGHWEVFLVEATHGFQVAPPNKDEAFRLEDTPDIKQECQDLVMQIAGRVPSEDIFKQWLKGCKDMNGIKEPSPNE